MLKAKERLSQEVNKNKINAIRPIMGRIAFNHR